MKYFVVEIQKNSEGTVSMLHNAYDDLNHAEAAYHSLLAVCALSELPRHGAMIIAENADVLKSEMYNHI